MQNLYAFDMDGKRFKFKTTENKFFIIWKLIIKHFYRVRSLIFETSILEREKTFLKPLLNVFEVYMYLTNLLLRGKQLSTYNYY